MAGAAVAIIDVGPADEAVAAIESRGGRALAFVGSVASAEVVANAVAQTVDRFVRLDILVNNAGVVERTTLESLDRATFDREIDIIARGTFLCTQAVYEVMKRQGGGKIVTISSISGKIGGATANRDGAPSARSGPAYAIAKGGIIAFTKWVAKDGGRYGIHANTICPGPTDTDLTRGFEYDVSRQPIPRLGNPADIAQVALFFASPMSNYITGQTLNVDGGVLMD